MYTLRKNDHIFEKVRKASARCNKRKQRREVKKGGGVSIYNIGEHVLLRFPFSSRVPKRRYILRGKIIERKKGQTSTELVIGPRMGTLKNVGSMFRTSQVLQKKRKQEERKKNVGIH